MGSAVLAPGRRRSPTLVRTQSYCSSWNTTRRMVVLLCTPPIVYYLYGTSTSASKGRLYAQTPGGARLDETCLLRHVHDLNTYRHNWQPSCDKVLRKYDVLLQSYGGGGSSSGFDFYRNRYGLRVNHRGDFDGLKHLSFWDLIIKLDICKSSAHMIIYQFDDPVNAVYSLFRRGYSRFQLKKLGVPFSPIHCGDKELFTDVATYAASGHDLFGFGNHLETYLLGGLHYSNIPIVFVKSTARDDPDVRLMLMHLWKHHRVSYNLNATWIPGDGADRFVFHNTNTDRYSNDPSFPSLSRTYAGVKNLQNELGRVSLAFKGTITRILA